MSTKPLLHHAKGTSLIRNSLLMMATQGANLVLGFVFFLIASKLLTREQVGIGADLIAAVTLCGAIGSVGVGSLLIRELPRSAGERWAQMLTVCSIAGVALTLAAAAVTVVVLPLISPDLARYGRDPLYVAAFVLAAVLHVLGELLDRSFVAQRASALMFARNTLVAVVRVALIAIPAVTALDAFGMAAAWVVAIALSVPYAVLMLRRARPGLRPIARGALGELRRMRHLFAAQQVISLSNMTPQFILPLLVTALVDPRAAALLVAAWRIAGGVLAISPAVSTSLLAEGSHDASTIRTDTRKATVAILALLVPAVFVLLVAGPYLLGRMGTPDHSYRGAFGLLAILLIAAVPDAITNVFVAVLRIEDRLRLAAAMTSGMAVLIVGLTALLVGPLGIEGAGIAWLIAQTAGCGVVAWDLLRRSGGRYTASATGSDRPA